MKIYKYTKAEFAQDILKNGRVKLTSPKDFNDPFDCLVNLSGINEKEVSLITNYYAFKIISQIVRSKKLRVKWWQKPLIWWTKLQLSAYRSMIKRGREYYEMPFYNSILHFASWLKQRDDPDFSLLTPEAKEAFFKQTKASIEEVERSLLVACFSERWDSILMWSHYADAHKGVCFEFDMPDDKRFAKVHYSKKRSVLDVEAITKVVLAYDYLGLDVDPSDPKLIQRVMSPFLTKSLDWKYEKEVRCLASQKETNKGICKNGDFWLFSMPEITAVYLGCKMAESTSKEIIKLAKSLNIPVFRIQESNEKYGLNKTPVNTIV
jgi:hypothetical protein